MTDCAMILAAGRGKRLRPYTDSCPKPLLEVNGKPLIFYHLESLALTGFNKVVINISWLGEQIETAVGDGNQFGLKVNYSHEPEALETAGGIVQALDMLEDRFIVVNADIYTDYAFDKLRSVTSNAHLVLVDDLEHNPQKDFALNHGHLTNASENRLTFSGISAYHKSFFAGLSPGKQSVVPLLRQSAEDGDLTGELHEGRWIDVGTAERWQSIRAVKKNDS